MPITLVCVPWKHINYWICCLIQPNALTVFICSYILYQENLAENILQFVVTNILWITLFKVWYHPLRSITPPSSKYHTTLFKVPHLLFKVPHHHPQSTTPHSSKYHPYRVVTNILWSKVSHNLSWFLHFSQPILRVFT